MALICLLCSSVNKGKGARVVGRGWSDDTGFGLGLAGRKAEASL